VPIVSSRLIFLSCLAPGVFLIFTLPSAIYNLLWGLTLALTHTHIKTSYGNICLDIYIQIWPQMKI